MGLLARFFGALPKEDRGGIRLTDAEPWRVSPTKDVEQFVRALPLLVPEDSVAYFEGTGESHVAAYLGRVSMPARAQVAVGTIWPKPDFYHVLVTAKNMDALAEFLERHPAGYFCSHCHVYRRGVVLLEWHDAFTGDPMYISRTIGREVVENFAQELGSAYSIGWAG